MHGEIVSFNYQEFPKMEGYKNRLKNDSVWRKQI